MAHDSSGAEESSPKTESSAIHNFWFMYWFCNFIMGDVDITESTELS
jgi:hypothetical protein